MNLLKRWAGLFLLSSMFAALVHGKVAEAQVKPPEVFGAKNTFGILGEYSNDSSAIIMGTANGEKLGAVGLRYERRLLSRPHFTFSYAGEFRPVIIESNTIQILTEVYTSPSNVNSPTTTALNPSCRSGTFPFDFPAKPIPFVGTDVLTCGGETTFASGLSPIGFRVNARPHRRLQPTFSSDGGYIFSTRALPVEFAGSFNFTFEFGAGFEYFRSAKRSWRVEYLIQHYSDGGSAYSNPGVDNGIFKVSYNFGR